MPTHFKHIKNITFLICLWPLLRLVWLGFHDNLGANPIEFIERSTGYWALFFLMLTLTLTPLRLLTKVFWPIQLRRMLGLYMFFYALLHLITYLFLDYGFDLQEILKDIVKHPYVIVGLIAFIFTVPLAATSNNAMIKKLGGKWKKLHQMVYLIAILAVVHFWWLVKKDIREPLLFALILTILLGIRIYYQFRKKV
jgi:sulfoxide reductase heme-binding subunit YedZ